MKIMRLGPGDGARLRAIRLAALQDAPDAFATTFDEAQALTPADWERQLTCLATFAAVGQGRDHGMVRGTCKADSASLLSLWVAPNARRQGVSRMLIGAVTDWARQQGCKQLFLDVADANAPAIALYDRLGFARTGCRTSLPSPRNHLTEHQRVLLL